MSMFFFDCFDGKDHLFDRYGIDLGTEAEARDQAAALAQSLIADVPLDAEARTVSVSVRAAAGPVIYVAHCGFTGCWTADRATSELDGG